MKHDKGIQRVRPMKRLTLALLLVTTMLAGHAQAGTLTVTSPNNGDFLGRSNTVRFQVKGARVQVKVTAVATLDSNPSQKVSVDQDFTPNVDGEVDGSLTLNFSEGTPAGAYTIKVTVTEPNNTYNTETRNVVIDTEKPQFLEVNPLDNSFVRGTVSIRVKLKEPNLKEWRVQVNGTNIPNNSGTSTNFEVRWDTSGILKDGPQTITITAKDQANNETSKTINVTLDRIAPTSTILAPTGTGSVRQQTNIPVAIDIKDQFSNSVDFTGIDVILQKMDGSFIQRVSRVSINAQDKVLRWSGRIRWTKTLPSQFKMIVNVTDRAGNVAVQQTVVVSYGR